MPVEPKSGPLSRRDFLKVTGAGLAAAAFGWREFGSAPSAYSLESGLRNLYVATTKKYEATPVPGSDVEGSLITYNPENFPRLESYWVQWKLQQEFGGNAQMVHRYLEQHNLYTKEQLDGKTTFGFLVQDRKNDKNTLYPYVIGPDRLTVPDSKDVFVYAWAGGSSFVKLEAAVYHSEEALSVLPGLEASTGGNFVIFGEPASTQQGTILPHFYYVWQEGSNFIPSMTFITPDGKNAVEIAMPRGGPKLASLVSAAAPEITNSEVKPAYTEIIDVEYRGVRMQVEVITDSTLPKFRQPVEKIFINENFKNQDGEKAREAIAHAVAYGIYKAWKLNGSEDQVGSRKNVSFSDYMKMWSECQKGEREWQDVEYEVVANDLATEKYDPEQTTMRPGPVKIVFIDPNYTQNITDIKDLVDKVAYAFATHSNNGKLEVWIGFPMQYWSRFGNILTYYLNMALNRLSLRNQNKLANPGPESPLGRMDDPDLERILNSGDWYTNYDTSLLVTPDDWAIVNK